jgi:hypothetical protein
MQRAVVAAQRIANVKDLLAVEAVRATQERINALTGHDHPLLALIIDAPEAQPWAQQYRGSTPQNQVSDIQMYPRFSAQRFRRHAAPFLDGLLGSYDDVVLESKRRSDYLPMKDVIQLWPWAPVAAGAVYAASVRDMVISQAHRVNTGYYAGISPGENFASVVFLTDPAVAELSMWHLDPQATVQMMAPGEALIQVLNASDGDAPLCYAERVFLPSMNWQTLTFGRL